MWLGLDIEGPPPYINSCNPGLFGTPTFPQSFVEEKDHGMWGAYAVPYSGEISTCILENLGRKLDSTPNMGIVDALEGLGLGNARVKGLGVWGLGFRDL